MTMMVPRPPSRSWISNPLMRIAAAALAVALALSTLGYLATSVWAERTLAEGAELNLPFIFEVLAVPYTWLSSWNHEVAEAVMVVSALYIGLVGLLLGFGAERDADEMARWRAVATLARSSSGYVSAAEAAVLVMPRTLPAEKRRWAIDRFSMVDRTTKYDFGKGRSATLYVYFNMVLTVEDRNKPEIKWATFDYTPAKPK